MAQQQQETRQQRRAREKELAKRLARSQKPQSKYSWRTLLLIPKWLYAVLGILVVAGGLLAWYPWLSLSQGERLQPENPFSTLFDVSNEGFMPIDITFVNCQLDSEDDARNGLGPDFYLGFPLNQRLYYKNKYTLPCYKVLKDNGLIRARMTMYIFYRFPLLPINNGQTFTVEGVKGSDNVWHWLSK